MSEPLRGHGTLQPNEAGTLTSTRAVRGSFASCVALLAMGVSALAGRLRVTASISGADFL